MELLNIIFSMTVVGTIIFILFMCLEQLTQHFFKASWHYNILKFIMLLFIIPIGKIVYFILQNILMRENSFFYRQGDAVPDYIYIIGDNLWKHSYIQYSIVAIWIAGMIIFLIRQMICFYRFRYIVINNRKIADENLCQMVDNCAKEMGIKRHVDLYINEYITTPMLTGIINPVILLPDNNINLEYAKYILSHELTHYKNKDVIVKRIAIIIKTVQWFNPLIYLLVREMDKWCEYTCDEKNSYNLTNEMKKMYGMAILEAAVDIPVYNSSFGASLFLPKQDLKKRLMFMFNQKKMRKKVICVSGIILIIFINAAVLFSFSAECFYIDNQQMINGIHEQDRGLQNNVSNAVSSKIQMNKFKYKAMD